MKRFAWILIVLAALPAWSASNKKITVDQLKDLLVSLQDAKKSDPEVASELKQVELTEELTEDRKNGLTPHVPGHETTEQLFVLEARSALLPPPPSDLPSDRAPDPAVQQAMLAKALDYASKIYAQLPPLIATRVTARFQDGVEGLHANNSMHTDMSANGDILRDQSSAYIRLVSLKTEPTESANGVEKIPSTKEKMPWGANGQVASIGPLLTLRDLLQQATAEGASKWLRWELINGKQTAVFSFSVDKKKSQLAVNYCCFPDNQGANVVNFEMAKGATPPPSGRDNLRSTADWKNFKAAAPYRGEIYIDPKSGAVVRTITEAEFKKSDPLRYEAVRTDYSRIPVGDKPLVVPDRSFTLADLIMGGDMSTAKSPLRHTFVTQTYKNYQLASTTASAQK